MNSHGTLKSNQVCYLENQIWSNCSMLQLGRQNLAMSYKMPCPYLKAKLSLENLLSALCLLSFPFCFLWPIHYPSAISSFFYPVWNPFCSPPVLLQLLDILRGPSPQTESSFSILCFLSETGGSQNHVYNKILLLHTACCTRIVSSITSLVT